MKSPRAGKLVKRRRPDKIGAAEKLFDGARRLRQGLAQGHDLTTKLGWQRILDLIIKTTRVIRRCEDVEGNPKKLRQTRF